MRTGLAATVAVLVIPLLAGCAADDGGPASAPSPGVPAAQLDAGRFYSFRHKGGALVFTLDGEGDAAFDLYDGADTRLGSVGFSSAPPRAGLHRIEGVAAGDVVIRLQTLNGTLRITSGGAGVGSFQPLAESVERVLLWANPARPDPVSPLGGFGVPLPTQQPADATVDVAFQRAPAELRLLATGPWQNLTVEVRSGRGPVLRSEGEVARGGGIALGPVNALAPLAAQATLQNLRDGRLTATVHADDLAGPVVLESRTYSRAALPGRAHAGPDPALLPFSYGALPDGPAAFAVHGAASRLVLWQEGAASNASDAAVALFGPHDERLGTLLVPPNGSVEAPTVGPGDYVAVLLAGHATLGADRAPADFQLRPLDVRETLAPAARAGSGSSDGYAVATDPVDAAHAFALRPGTLAGSGGDLGQAPDPFGACDAGRFLVVAQGGEALMASLEPLDGAAPDPSPFADGTLALGAGPLTVTHDGFGDDGCPRPAVTVVSYERA